MASAERIVTDPPRRAPAEPPWLTEDEQAAWRAFLHTHAVLTAMLNRELTRESDLSLQDYGVLVALSEADDDQLRPYELGRLLGVEKSRLSHQVARLSERGLVTRRQCAEDRRGWLIRLTARGRRALAAAAPGHVAAVRSLFVDRLTPAQLASLLDISRAVLANPAVAECEAEEGGSR